MTRVMKAAHSLHFFHQPLPAFRCIFNSGRGKVWLSDNPGILNQKGVLAVTEAEMSDNPAHLARKILEYYYREGRLPQQTGELEPAYKVKAGAFVSLKKGKQLRGCIGTVEPVRENLAAEIAANAVAAAERDPRFASVTAGELKELDISVDVLSPMERVKSKSELDPRRYGVLVRSGPRSGLLLPDLEGIDSVEEQLTIARHKAGIKPGEPEELYRFTVGRFRESDPIN